MFRFSPLCLFSDPIKKNFIYSYNVVLCLMKEIALSLSCKQHVISVFLTNSKRIYSFPRSQHFFTFLTSMNGLRQGFSNLWFTFSTIVIIEPSWSGKEKKILLWVEFTCQRIKKICFYASVSTTEKKNRKEGKGKLGFTCGYKNVYVSCLVSFQRQPVINM